MIIKFTDNELKQCFDFAKAMRGNHNPNMLMKRDDWEIFRDDFRGKLGEIAVYNYIKQHIPSASITCNLDFTVTGRGQWDITDLIINNQYINVKSIKQNSSFLMIETLRYDQYGNYTYCNNNNDPVVVDYYTLVRVTVEPDVQKNIFSQDLQNFLSNSYDAKLQKAVPRNIYAEILGGISHNNFWKLKRLAQQGIKCDKYTLNTVCNGYNVQPLSTQEQQKLNKNNILQQHNYIVAQNNLYSLETLFQPAFLYICIKNITSLLSIHSIFSCDYYCNIITTMTIPYPNLFSEEIAILEHFSKILKLPYEKIHISYIANIKIYIDDNLPEYMSGVLRIGNVEAYDINDNSLGCNSNLVDNTEFTGDYAQYYMRSYVAQRLSVPIDIIRIE